MHAAGSWIGLPLLSALLVAGIGQPHAAGGAVIQYREGEFPNSAYSHLGSELRLVNPSYNFGSRDVIFHRRLPPFPHQLRTVLGFDLDGIPTEASITSINLQMFCGYVGTYGAVVEA